MRAWQVALLIWGALLCAASGLQPASAHATLVASDPGDGATVAAAPARLILTFNEPVSALVLRLSGPEGKARALPAPDGRFERLVVPLPLPLTSGTHALSWRVISLDGHPVGGTLVFSVGAPQGSAVGPSSSDGTVPRLIWASRIGLYVGCFFGIGGFVFTSLIAVRRAGERMVAAFAIMGIVAAILSVGLQGLDALGLEINAVATSQPWKTGLATSFGLSACLATAALAATLLGLRTRSPRARLAAALGALVVTGAAFAASGHAAAASPPWLTRPAVALHAVAVAFWVGALMPLILSLRHEGRTEPLVRFARIAPWAVLVLVLTGAILVLTQVSDPASLTTSAYGRILLAKLALVVLLLLVAAWNRWRATGPALRGDATAGRLLRRAILAEIVLVLGIFGLVAAWRFTPPPRTPVRSAEAPASIHIHTPRAMADVRFAPVRPGTVMAEIDLLTGELGPLDAKEVSLAMENREAGFEAILRPAVKIGSAWHVAEIPVPAAGLWQLRLDILVDDFDKVTLEGEVQVPRR